jgi:hypothetical protein
VKRARRAGTRPDRGTPSSARLLSQNCEVRLLLVSINGQNEAADLRAAVHLLHVHVGGQTADQLRAVLSLPPRSRFCWSARRFLRGARGAGVLFTRPGSCSVSARRRGPNTTKGGTTFSRVPTADSCPMSTIRSCRACIDQKQDNRDIEETGRPRCRRTAKRS